MTGPSQKPYCGGDALIDALKAYGLDTAFGVPGESYLAALDAVARREFRFITCRHEAAACNMAEAAGKLTGRPGLCFVTRGPGTTHATTGLHTAYQDSTPMILLIGQVARDQRDREAFQELDYRQFLSEVTKWTAEIDDADRIGEYVGRAVSTALSGRPGPVALALPEDMLSGPAARVKVKPFSVPVPHPDNEHVQQVARRLENAERPFLLVGGSGWTTQAVQDLRTFAEQLRLPVSASFRCQDRLDNRSPSYIGDMGIGANPALVERLQNADLILALGPRLGEMTTAGYSRLTPPVPDQPLIHIHQGGEELGHVYQPDIALQSAPGPFLKALSRAGVTPNPHWAGHTKAARAAYEAWQQPTSNPGPVQLAALYSALNEELPEDAILTNGAGNYAAWLHRFAVYRHFPSQLAPTSGAMGYGLPAALAAKTLAPARTVVAFAGDGCFMMAASELATALHHGLGILVLVFNNGLYGTIRMHQARDYPGRPSGTTLTNPDFVRFAESFGAHAERVTNTAAFRPALKTALKAIRQGQPALLEILVDPDAISPAATLASLETTSS